jgi:succinoglycan biosynthesis transport protein ExoP
MSFGPMFPINGQVYREVQPNSPIEFSRQPGSYVYAPAMQESGVREYYRTLLKHKWAALSTLVVIFSVITIATLRTTPIYESAGTIAITKPDSGIVNFKDSTPEWDYYDPTEMDTEVRILKSDLLSLQVLRALGLDKGPTNLSATDANALNLTGDAENFDSPRISALISSFKSGLTVAMVPNTRIIEVRYRSPNKELAARAVNTLISTYEEQNFKTRYESTMEASDWLSRQLADLQMKVETSTEKLVQYQKQHEILGTDDKQNIITSKLSELNKELTEAESQRMEKQAVYELMQSGDANTVSAAAMGVSSSSDSKGESSLLEKLQSQDADLRIQSAELSTQFGPSYPKVQQLNTQLKEVAAQIQLQTKKVLDSVHDDYMAALQREKMLSAALDKQKQQANALNESSIEYNLLNRDVESNRTLYEGLLQKLKEAGVTAGLRSTNIRKVDQARVPNYPSSPNIPRNLTFALALGLSSGIGLAFLLEALDNTVRTPEQAQAISGLPSLGMIPLGSRQTANLLDPAKRLALAASKEVVELVSQSRPQSQMAESYRALRTSLLLTSSGAPPKTILVTSALPQEGKSTTSINCAIVLAQKDSRVLLIDADLRRPSIHKTLGLGPKIGLSDVLTGNATLQQAIVRSPIAPSLFILAAGTPPPNPAELLASSHMRDVLSTLREQYDHVVIDTPPTLSVTDAVVMSTSADAVVLVIRSGQTTKQALRRSRELLGRVNARVSGVLLNAVDLRSPDYYYYYEYQGKYGKRYYQEDSLDAGGSDSSGNITATPA